MRVSSGLRTRALYRWPRSSPKAIAWFVFYQAQAMAAPAFALFRVTSCLESDWGWELKAGKLCHSWFVPRCRGEEQTQGLETPYK